MCDYFSYELEKTIATFCGIFEREFYFMLFLNKRDHAVSMKDTKNELGIPLLRINKMIAKIETHDTREVAWDSNLIRMLDKLNKMLQDVTGPMSRSVYIRFKIRLTKILTYLKTLYPKDMLAFIVILGEEVDYVYEHSDAHYQEEIHKITTRLKREHFWPISRAVIKIMHSIEIMEHTNIYYKSYNHPNPINHDLEYSMPFQCSSQVIRTTPQTSKRALSSLPSSSSSSPFSVILKD